MMVFLFFLLISSTQANNNNLHCPPTKVSIENSLRDANIPGLAAVVVNSTSILYEQAFGYNSPLISNERQPIDSVKTIFTLASISKTFIAVAVMQLVECHQLDLDKDINQYLTTPMKVIHPFYPNVSITVRHVLSHTAGIGPNFIEEMQHYMPKDDFTKTNLSDIVLSYTSNELNWLKTPPGTIMHYSSTSASLAALIVEQITHVTFEQYVHEKILQPLGINKTEAGYRLNDFENRKQDLIQHYLFNSSWLERAQSLLPQLNITRASNTSNWLFIPPYGFSDYPAGLLRMSAHSLAVYLQSFLNDFLALLFNSSLVNELIYMPFDHHTDAQIALIWNWRVFHGRRFVGHQGAMPGITNMMMANEKRTLGVIILSNGDITKYDDLATKIYQTIVDLMIQLFNCFE